MDSPIEFDPRRFSADRPPVVLLGGLNVLRALGRAGIPVIVAAASRDEVALASRYCCGRVRLPSLDDPRAVVDVLLRAGERLTRGLGRRAPLFYSNDAWQRLVQNHRTELSRHYRLLLNNPELADALIEKDLFQPLAAARGLPIPRMLDWASLEGWSDPVLVKPRSKFTHDLSAAHTRLFGRQGKACIFSDGRALLADPAALQLRDAVLIQEYVAGDDRAIWSFHGFCDEDGRLLDWFIGRKIRTYPQLTGMSSYLELARDAELAELGPRIVSALGLKGVFKIDLKRDTRTGQLRLLEVNARYNLWHHLAAANGLNLPLTAYEYLVEGRRPAAPRPYRTTYRWVYLRMDWLAYRELAGRGELSLRQWVGSLLAAPKVCQLFSWRDPLPLLYRLKHLYCRLTPRLGGKLRRWLSTAS